MKATYRRGIGILITLVVLMVYTFFAASVGSLLADKPWYAQIGFFAVAGIGWVFPLYPVYVWMRRLDPDEAALEKPPVAAATRKR
ncbi:DUF2842 domain-containing protein [Candidatus Phycosocius spiralis]|uniref:DUF2842 domain-containing protein n=1 Tax=Candidatus Phycosocius spiralis TaxID=2815099 RepID=A0ABQ4PYR8_9PROT|nr:DUF2842 domain-containing protein [Candidatus Phycosocius spiralis]GIU68101.1 hypothetical protein PsB1_2255 [Candidatus Phycosocius spiralis]